jgi:hypothetical protein
MLPPKASPTDPLAVVLRDYGRRPLPADPVAHRASLLLDDAGDRLGRDIVLQCLDKISADQLRDILNTLRQPDRAHEARHTIRWRANQ